MAERINYGDKVRCYGYIKARNHLKREVGKARFNKENDFCYERYEIKSKAFTGLCVGFTKKSTITEIHFIHLPFDIMNYKENPKIVILTDYEKKCAVVKEFAVVYYGDNRKRLVPIDMVEKI